MIINNYTPNYKPILFKGYVYYEDMTPVKNAIVLLEVVLYDGERAYTNTKLQNSYSYTTTNRWGQFYFQIFDPTRYYKIKIFDNQHIN